MRILTAEDVQAVLVPAEIIAAIAELWTEEGRATSQAPARVTFDVEHGWFRVMPGALIGGRDRPVMGAKIMNLNRGRGIQYLFLLYDASTGELLSLLDASVLTQVRTGAVSAAFLRRLFKNKSIRLGLFGTGFEARGQLQMIAAVVELDEVRVYSRSSENRERFAREMSQTFDLPVQAVDRPESAADQPVVVLATRSTVPVVRGEWFLGGAVVVSVGSTRRELREVDAQTVARSHTVLVDHQEQALAESGDLQEAMAAGMLRPQDLVDVGTWLAKGPDPAYRTDEEGLLLFKPSGTAVQDLAIARIVYARCRERGLGREIEDFLTLKRR